MKREYHYFDGQELNSTRQPLAPLVPMKIKRWNGFSATNAVKARLHQTEPPNALPTSERCPGQPRMLYEVLSLTTPDSLSVMAATIATM